MADIPRFEALMQGDDSMSRIAVLGGRFRHLIDGIKDID